MAAINKLAATAANRPIHGLAFPNFSPAAYVTAAAVNPPASIFPSSAMLMTPERSEKSPPSAASNNGVAVLIVEANNAQVKISLIFLNSRTCDSPASPERQSEERFSRNKENDDTLQTLDDVFGHMLRESVDVDTSV